MYRKTCLIIALLLMLVPAFAQQNDEQLAAYYYNNGEYEQAIQLYEKLYQRTPNQYYYQRIYQSLLATSDFSSALRVVEKRRKANPRELSLYVDEGIIYIKKGDKKKAERCFDKALSSLTRDMQPVAVLVTAFEGIGRYDYAASVYRKMRENTGNRYLYFAELIGEYQMLGQYEEMTKEYFTMLDEQPYMLNTIQISMQRMMQDVADDRLIEGIKSAIVQRVQENPLNKSYNSMLIWFALQQKDFDFALTQSLAIVGRFPEEGEEQVLQVAQIARTNDALDVAERGYKYLQSKGQQGRYYLEGRIGELDIDYLRLSNGYVLDSAGMFLLRGKYLSAIEELGKNERTITLMRQYADLLAYHYGSLQEAVDMLDEVLAMPRIGNKVRSEVKLELGDILLFAGEMWDATLLYMQVEKDNKDDVLGATAKFRNARLSYFRHDFDWAKAQLNVLRASTSKLIANDAMELSLLISDNMEDDSTYTMLSLFADADLMLYMGRLKEAWNGFDSIERRVLSHPLFDEILLRKADIRLREGNYAAADSLLNRLVEGYPFEITADDAWMKMAQINEQHLNNIDRARQCYEKIILDYPTSLYVTQARKRYNELKKR